MKPGYFESPWYAIVPGARILDHGLGRIPTKHKILFSTDSLGSSVVEHIPYFCVGTSPDYGTYLNFKPSTNTTMTCYTDGNTGIFMNSSGTWVTSGYQKHIVEFD